MLRDPTPGRAPHREPQGVVVSVVTKFAIRALRREGSHLSMAPMPLTLRPALSLTSRLDDTPLLFTLLPCLQPLRPLAQQGFSPSLLLPAEPFPTPHPLPGEDCPLVPDSWWPSVPRDAHERRASRLAALRWLSAPAAAELPAGGASWSF